MYSSTRNEKDYKIPGLTINVNIPVYVKCTKCGFGEPITPEKGGDSKKYKRTYTVNRTEWTCTCNVCDGTEKFVG